MFHVAPSNDVITTVGVLLLSLECQNTSPTSHFLPFFYLFSGSETLLDLNNETKHSHVM